MPVAGAVTTLRLIILRVVMRRSPLRNSGNITEPTSELGSKIAGRARGKGKGPPGDSGAL